MFPNGRLSLIRPIKGDFVVTHKYGTPQPPGSYYEYHHGVDLAADVGTPVFAMLDGTIQVENGGGYGLHIIETGINPLGTITVIYAHLSAAILPGKVTAGQQIGETGQSGNATGPHLHIGMKINGNFVNPLTYIKGAAKNNTITESQGIQSVLGRSINNIPGMQAIDRVWNSLQNLESVIGGLTDAFNWITDPRNWERIGLIVGGAVLVILAALGFIKGRILNASGS